MGTSAAARVVVNMGTTAASAEEEEEEEEAEDDSAAVIANALHVPKGLWCYRLDRRRAVLGGSLTDGGSVFEWLRTTLALGVGVDMDAVMREAEEMPPADHGLVVSADCSRAPVNLVNTYVWMAVGLSLLHPSGCIFCYRYTSYLVCFYAVLADGPGYPRRFLRVRMSRRYPLASCCGCRSAWRRWRGKGYDRWLRLEPNFYVGVGCVLQQR